MCKSLKKWPNLILLQQLTTPPTKIYLWKQLSSIYNVIKQTKGQLTLATKQICKLSDNTKVKWLLVVSKEQ